MLVCGCRAAIFSLNRDYFYQILSLEVRHSRGAMIILSGRPGFLKLRVSPDSGFFLLKHFRDVTMTTMRMIVPWFVGCSCSALPTTASYDADVDDDEEEDEDDNDDDGARPCHGVRGSSPRRLDWSCCHGDQVGSIMLSWRSLLLCSPWDGDISTFCRQKVPALPWLETWALGVTRYSRKGTDPLLY